jgi:hypothetical protein
VSFGTPSTRANSTWTASVALRQRNGESIARVAPGDIKHFAAHLRPSARQVSNGRRAPSRVAPRKIYSVRRLEPLGQPLGKRKPEIACRTGDNSYSIHRTPYHASLTRIDCHWRYPLHAKFRALGVRLETRVPKMHVAPVAGSDAFIGSQPKDQPARVIELVKPSIRRRDIVWSNLLD